MRKVNLFSLAFAAMMLGACSSDEIAVNENGSVPVLPGETGYISLSINLPTTPSTRANDQFDDGDAAEYAVKDATLLLFNGTSEADAKLSEICTLDVSDPDLGETNPSPNITSTYKLIQDIKKPESGNLYALVIVNKGEVLTEEEGIWKLNQTPLTTGTTTLEAFNNAAQTLSADDLADLTTKGFFMTNAPLYTIPGGTMPTTPPTGGKVMTLTEINPNNVYTTEEEAKANPAASIYVERAVAKVTVKGGKDGSTTSGTLTDVINGAATMSYELTGWTLDVTNKETYIVRNVNDGNNWWGLTSSKAKDYRFVGSVAVGSFAQAGSTTSDLLYRTYWGIDPNYDGTGSYIPSKFNMLTGTTPTGSELKNINDNAYCLENTFDVANMKQNQTTRVIVAAKLNNGNDFYIVDNDKSKTYTETEAIDAIKAKYLSNPTVVAALTDSESGLLEDKSISGKDLIVKFDDTEGKPTNGGDLTVAEITINEDRAGDFKKGVIPNVLTAEGNNTIIEAVNAGKKVSLYKGGISYYPVMIKHFGDDQTEWDSNDANGTDSYNNNTANFLGRYGVLRNNWYEIEVTGIKGIGSAEVPEVYGTPDDPAETFISVEINILSWAKRSQSVEL